MLIVTFFLTTILCIIYIIKTKQYFNKTLWASAKLQGKEEERIRIATALHDNVIAQLHQLNLQVDNKLLQNRLQTIIQLVRNISHSLSPPMFNRLSLAELIQDVLNNLKHHYDITFYITSTVQYTLTQQQKLQLFRIFQEITTNIIKHANATSINVHLKYTQHYVAIHIKDNGQGFDQQLVSQNGLGLQNIALYAQALQAQYRIKTLISKGTSFTLLIPKPLYL